MSTDETDGVERDRVPHYRSLLRWYPAEWRARNQDAVIGTLMDEDDAAGRTSVPPSTAMSLVFGALQERFVAPERATPSSVIVLVLGSFFSAWYLFVIAWSPGADYDGTVGPFANPSVLIGLCLAASLVLALVGRARTSRLVALLGSGVALVVGVLAAVLDWLGPSSPAVVIFAGFGLVAATRLERVRDGVRVAVAWFLLVVCAVAAEDAVLMNSPVTSVPVIVALAIAVSSLAGVIALMWPTRRRQVRRQ